MPAEQQLRLFERLKLQHAPRHPGRRTRQSSGARADRSLYRWPIADFAMGEGAHLALPESVQEIADVIGRREALLLCEGIAWARGGRRCRLYVPRVENLDEGDPLARILGSWTARAFCEVYGGIEMDLPTCRDIRMAHRDAIIRRLLCARTPHPRIRRLTGASNAVIATVAARDAPGARERAPLRLPAPQPCPEGIVVMDNRNVQRLLVAANYYRGDIHGVADAATWRGVLITERNDAATSSAAWSERRRLVAAGQRILNAMGFEAGVVDGYAGHNTMGAMTVWEKTREGILLRDRRDDPEDHDDAPAAPEPMQRWPRQRDMASVFGPPAEPQASAARAVLPFSFVLDWNRVQSVRSVAAHPLVAPVLERALKAAAAHYGEALFRRLDLDKLGGVYNPRRIRGGRAWSTHAYGAAIDLHPGPNGNHTPYAEAQFSRPDYDAFHAIMEAEGLVNLGRAIGRDAMHWQAARL